MDNLTHSLAGWALGRTGLERKTRKGLTALVMGANMPDVDVFLGWVPWTALATHRGWTHSLVGGAVFMPPLLAGLLWLLDRWQSRRGAAFADGPPMHFGWLVALSYLGTLTHPLLDWQTTYSVQLFSPFDVRWYHTDALFIIDLWVLIALGGSIWLSRRRERAGIDGRLPALVGVAAVIAYIAANGLLSAHYRDAAERWGRPDVVYASPPPVAFWRREVAARRGHWLTWFIVDPLRGLSERSGPVPDRMDDPLVGRALRLPQSAKFARWSTMPFASMERTRCAVRVSLGDARYGRTARGNRLGQVVVLPTGGAGC